MPAPDPARAPARAPPASLPLPAVLVLVDMEAGGGGAGERGQPLVSHRWLLDSLGACQLADWQAYQLPAAT